MNTSFRRLCAAVLAAACFLPLLTGMGGKPQSPDDLVTISKVSIQDKQVLNRNLPLIVTFSAPMVTDEAIDKPVAERDMPFAVYPKVEGAGAWLTPSTFSFTASKGYARGRQYSVVFREDLKALDGKAARYFFSFSTEATTVGGIWMQGSDAKSHLLSFDMQFSPPVSVEALREHLEVRDAASGEALPLEFREARGETRYHNMKVSLGKPRKELRVSIRLDGEADAAPLGLAAPYSTTIALPDPSPAGDDPSVAVVKAAPSSQPSPITLREPYSYEEDAGKVRVTFPLSRRLPEQDQKDLIAVSPALPYTVNESGSTLVFAEGVKPGMEITVTLKTGLLDSSGLALKEDRSRTFRVRDLSSTVRFAEQGNLLTPVYGGRVGINLVNVDRVNVSLRRQYDNNLPFMSFEPEDMARRMMEYVGVRELPVKGDKNEVLRRAFDIDSLAKGKRGVFWLRVEGYRQVTHNNGRTGMEFESSDERLVVLSDIGITARAFPSGITVFAAGISTAKPLPGAEVRVYSDSNQLVAKGKTGPDGIFIHTRDEVWKEQLRPAVVTVGAGDDLTFLALDGASGIPGPVEGGRAYLDKGYEAFLYTPRGVFRPGETVDIKAFVRDAAHKTPAPFPVQFAVQSARGLEISRGSAALSDQGGAEYSFTLPRSAPTGEYRAFLAIPGQEARPLGGVTFSVEDFVPPRLEVSVTPDRETVTPERPLAVALSGRYLFGAPGAGLKYELGYKATPKNFSPKGWEGYVFGDMERKAESRVSLKYLSGELGEDGAAKLDFSAPDDWAPPSAMQVLLIGGVQEDGGRWVSQTAQATWFPSAFLLGLNTGKDYATPGKPLDIKVAAVDPDGKAAEAGALDVEISLVQGMWHTVYRENRYVYTYDERFIPQRKMRVETRDGKGSIAFTPEREGRYLVRCAAEGGKIVASRRISAWMAEGAPFGDGTGGDGTGRADLVELTLDKKEYLPGEKAKLSVKAPYAGTLLLGVERGAQIFARSLPMTGPATTVEIPVTAEMGPNAAVTAWVIRPVRQENKEWFAHRAHGTTSLALSKVPHTLAVEAAAPARAEPSKGLSIPFAVTDAEGKPVQGEFSVALVDEGILSLTAFKTPDPAGFFLARRRGVGASYDAYDALLRPEARATALLAPGGDGTGEEDYQGSLSTQQIFLAAFLPTVRTNAEGKGEAFFDLPEYSGKGRLMIVGAAGDRFASAAAPVRVARDIVVEATAPRAVAPGDTFEIAVKAFPLPEAVKEGKLGGEAVITVSADGPLELSGDVKTRLLLGGTPGGKNAAVQGGKAAAAQGGGTAVNEDGKNPAKGVKDGRIAVRARAGNEAGVATIAVEVTVPGRDDLAFTRYVDVVVRPPFPRGSAVNTALVEAGSGVDIKPAGKWLPGSVKTSLSVDRSPVLSVLPALEYLREYPYGCLEQTTSRAWPYLTLATVQKALYPEGDAETNSSAALGQIVARVSSMLNTDGGFGMWPGYSTSSPFLSVQATWFLVEAKAKVPVSRDTLARNLSYLRYLLAAPVATFSDPAHAYTTKAYAAFVLTRAGQAPLSWMQFLSEHEKAMRPSGRIFLAAAKALNAGKPDALRALQESELKLEIDRLGYNESMESPLRNQSLRLLAWSLVAPGDPQTLKLCESVAALVSAQRWYTTQDAGMAALALGTFLEKTGGGKGDFTAELSARGKALASVQGVKTPLVLGGDRLPLQADGAPENVTVKVAGKDPAYVVYNVRGVPAVAPAPAANGLAVKRVWRDDTGKVIDTTKPVIVSKGDRITVELQLASTRPVANVALSDLLPGGFEVENPRLKTAASAAAGGTSTARAPESEDPDEPEENGAPAKMDGMYLDLREDRILVFYDRLSGKETYSYSLRAVSKGTFCLPPLAAEGMYEPSANAVTAAGSVTVK